MKTMVLIATFLTGFLFNSFAQEVDMNIDWNKLAAKKIFFGHQSVGYNIMDGVTKLAEGRLNIKKTKDPADFTIPVFAHAQVGKNQDPFAKIDDFKTVLDSGIGSQVDIAFLKLCYVDIEADTNLDKLFKHYTTIFAQLQEAYPDVLFIHFAVPLRTTNTGIKARIKRMVGKPVWGDKENIARNEYNKKLAQEYAKTGRYFDLASFEAISPDGKVTICATGGKNCLALYAGYTDDGSHLGQLGQKVIARKLLEFLAQVK